MTVASRATTAATLAEAFRITAADHPDRVAVRTKDDEVSLTWSGLRERVDALAGGLARLGVRRGDTVALMLAQPAGVPRRRPGGDDAGRDAVLDLRDLHARADRLRRR
jgi:non-ribosomal peptide synthetase component F